MKEKLTDDSRRALVRYRIERAKQTLKEAEYMRDGGDIIMQVSTVSIMPAIMLHRLC